MVYVRALGRHVKKLVAAPLLAGLLGLGGSYLIAPEFTSTTTFLPPQQQQSSAMSALASLGALAGLAGGSSAVKSPADQYVAFLQSTTVSDKIIEKFKLLEVYDKDFRQDARKELAKRVQISAGKKDGLVSITVEDRVPARAAEMANHYVTELRALTSNLAITEAQQRRVFFEKQLQDTKQKLVAAQTALQGSGFDAGVLKTEPKASAEQYATLRAQLTSAEVKLQLLKATLADGATELRQQEAMISELRRRLAALEQVPATALRSANYIGNYREYKYQETLFDLMAKQFELARIDESREGALIQVIDVAVPGERKVKPNRGVIAAGAAVLALLAVLAWALAPVHFKRPNAAAV